MKFSMFGFPKLLLILNLTVACVPVPSTTETRATGFKGISFPKKVAILVSQEKIEKYRMSSCVSKSLSSAIPELKVVSPEESRRLLVPLFEGDQTPKDENELARQLHQPDRRARLQSLDFTYLILLRSEHKVVDKQDLGSCFGGCVGVGQGTEIIYLTGVVWDVRNIDPSGTIHVKSTGTSSVAALIIPMGLIAFPKGAACDAFMKNLENSWLKREN